MKRIHILIAFMAVLFSFARCSTKEGAIDTTLTVEIGIQELKNGDTTHVDIWKGYYLVADGKTYEVDNFQNAVNGTFVLVEKDEYGDDEERVEVPYTGTADSGPGFLKFNNLSASSVYLLVVHEERGMYAWRQMDFVDGLGAMFVRLTFKPHQKTDTPREEVQKWNYVYDSAIVVEPEPELPTFQVNTYLEQYIDEKDPAAGYKYPYLTTARGYYLEIGPDEEYTVESYANAVNRVLTPVYTGEREPVAGTSNATGVLMSDLPAQGRVLLVVYDTVNRVYGYRYYNVPPEGDGSDRLYFYRLSREDVYTDNEWTIDVRAVEDPDPEDPDPEPGLEE